MRRVKLLKLTYGPSAKLKMAATGQPTPSGGKRTLHLLLALGLGLLACSSWLQAQTAIYVDAKTSVEVSDGSQAKPYQTVTAAITAARGGDSIILARGTISALRLRSLRSLISTFDTPSFDLLWLLSYRFSFAYFDGLMPNCLIKADQK